MFYIKTSIRQLLRTPVKTLLFILLLAAATVLLVFGSVLFLQTQAHIEAVEDQFTTIGMVTQLPSSTRTVTWENSCGAAGTAIYDVYDEILPLEVLDFEGANYIRPPESRVLYMGRAATETASSRLSLPRAFFPAEPSVVELQALEDSLDGEPVWMQVVQTLAGYLIPGSEVSLCQHYTDETLPIQEGEKYMAYIRREFCEDHRCDEYIPMPALYSSQYNPDGTPMEGSAPSLHLFRQDEDGAWITSHTPGGSPADYGQAGQMIQREGEDFSMNPWFEWGMALKHEKLYYPAIATNSLDLVPSFHSKLARIVDGRSITQEEFDEGAKVCLIPDFWNIDSNQFSPGETSYLQLSITLGLKNYPAGKFDALGASSFFAPFSYFSADGRTYTTFSGAAYQIVGTYTVQNASSINSGDVDLTYNTIIIPSKSLAETEANIAYFAPMSGTYVSFQIPNGTIAEFDKKLHEAVPEADILDIAYSDNGYEEVMPGLERTRTAALLLCGVGVAAAIAVIMLLLYFFITRERKRTAIERGLGMTKRQCRVSLVSGILVLALVGTILGSAAGALMVSSVDMDSDTADLGSSYSVYSTEYSDWTNKWNQVIDVQETEPVPLAALSLGIPLAMLTLITTLSLVLVGSNLRVEPIQLLGSKED